MKYRNVKAVIRFHKPSKTTDPEKYFHHVLMLYFPWREESDLIGPEGTYASKLHDPLVRQTVNRNQTSFEPYGETVEEALEYIQDNPQYSLYGERFDAFAEQENCEIREELLNPTSDNHSHDNDDEILPELSSGQNAQTTFPVLSSFQPSQIDDDSLRSLVRSLNKNQRDAYEIVLKWCRDKVEGLNSGKPYEAAPVHVFITGGAGAGKSHIIKTIYQTATKIFRHGPEDPDKPSILLLAPIGVVAINIGGNTINSGLAISKNIFGEHVGPLSNERKSALRTKLPNLKLIVIDEVSVVSNLMLKYIHERLKENLLHT